jgi:hypothetical protein
VIWRGTLAHTRSFAEALFSDQDKPASAQRIDWLVCEFEAFLSASAAAGARAPLTLGLCLWVCEWIAPLFIRKLGPLTELALEDRVRALDRMERSALGPCTLAPKAMLCLLWFEHPEVQRETRTEPSCMTERSANRSLPVLS